MEPPCRINLMTMSKCSYHRALGLGLKVRVRVKVVFRVTVRFFLSTQWRKRKEIFYLTTHSTHLIYRYMVSDHITVKDHSDSEKGNLLPPLFPINSKGSFICTIPLTG